MQEMNGIAVRDIEGNPGRIYALVGDSLLARYDASWSQIWQTEAPDSVIVNGIGSDPQDNIYAAGMTTWNMGDTLYPDLWIGKYDEEGNLLWQDRYQVENDLDMGVDVVADTDAVYVVGEKGAYLRNPGTTAVYSWTSGGAFRWIWVAPFLHTTSHCISMAPGLVNVGFTWYAPGDGKGIVRLDTAGTLLDVHYENWVYYNYPYRLLGLSDSSLVLFARDSVPLLKKMDYNLNQSWARGDFTYLWWTLITTDDSGNIIISGDWRESAQDVYTTKLTPDGQNVEIPENAFAGPPPSLFLEPNPTSGPVRMSFVLPDQGTYSLKAYDPAGRMIALISEGQASGPVSLEWVPDLASGVYFIRLETGAGAITRTLLLQ